MRIFRHLLALLICISGNFIGFSQQTNNWYFGSAAGFPNTGLRIDFTSGSPVVSTCNPILTEEGSSGISDATGKSLFYTDGVTAWDASTNASFGTGLLGGSSTTQSAIVMPKPGTTNQWFIFTSGTTGLNGINYYTVTGVSATSGPFTISGATNLVPAATVGEGLFVIGSTKAGSSFWVIARDQGNTGVVRAWDVSNTGVVNATEVTSTLSGAAFTNTDYTSKIGTIKSNTCQNKLAFTYLSGDVDITDFNTATGQVVANTAKRITVTSTGGNSGSYGIEFSPNDAYLYITNLASSNLYKYDIAANTNALMSTLPSGEAGQLQLGPDGKIYMARNTGSAAPSYLGVISNPSTAGATFSATGVTLTSVMCGGNTGFAYRGLPTFPKTLVVTNPVISPGDGTYCTNTAINLSYLYGGSISSLTWSYTGGGGTFTPGGATSTSNTPSISFTTTGAKTVTLSITDACARVWTNTINLTITAPATPAGAITCTSNGFIMDNPAVDPNEPNYIWYKNSVAPGNIIGIGTPVTYLAGGNSAQPAQVCLGVASSASVSSSGSNSIGNTAASMTWAANGTPHTSPGIDVLSDVLVLKSFDVRFWTCPATLNVVIKNGSGTTIYNENFPITGCSAGSSFTINTNTTLLKGSNYTITVSGAGAQFQGGAWTGGTNAGQISYAAGGVGTNSVGNLQYDYKNFSIGTGCSSNPCYTINCPLPVELYYFNAARKNDIVLLSWATSMEINNDYFEIERSLDGISFDAIGKVKGKGNSSEISNYATVDHEPLSELTYYRIVQYDFNGARHLGPIRIVEAVENQNIEVYPNPSAQQFNVVVPDSKGSVITVTDVLGREIYSKTLEEGETKILLNAEWPKGNYILHWTSDTSAKTVHLVKD